MTWSPDLFDELARTREVRVIVPAPGREPVRVPIWIVAAGDALYVRSWKGDDGLWYRRARRHGTGALETSAGEQRVRFVPPEDPAVEAAVDRVYRDKYADSPYGEAMAGPPATSTTLRVEPVAD
ncbi:DUF2255 family protein [Pseudosporangium ferrugineum]|uniref:DUF2255 family protein n=1 Tax=Pseudosporangium ferrugineum TaxID=439699 RepID=A0A2T0RLD5_9ACTN|nr:DUF2255 family protein [Pseudosporangium ferrugineum]PRY22006.1 hypothetical protein CLV70_11871 [Pseudosporangium ferrugineum]